MQSNTETVTWRDQIERFINVTIAGVAHAVLLGTHHYDTATKEIVSKTE